MLAALDFEDFIYSSNILLTINFKGGGMFK